MTMLNIDKAGQIAELQQRAYHIRQHALRMGQYKAKAMLTSLGCSRFARSILFPCHEISARKP